jgi:hypothetical protein
MSDASISTVNTSAKDPELLAETGEDITNYDDIWLLPEEAPLHEANFKSWDAFEDRHIEERKSPYITEIGRASFDAALADEQDPLKSNNSQHVVVDTKVYTASLLALGLGRSSIFFDWHEDEQTFRPAISGMRISGLTGESMDDLLIMFMDCGNITKSLQTFIHQSYTESVSPSRVALADAISTLLATIQAHLSANTSIQNSILQLQSLFQPAHSILKCFQQVVKNISTTRNDESMLSTIFQEIQLLDDRCDSLRDVFLEILSRVSRPWLNFCGEWLGLQRETDLALSTSGPGKGFVKVENKEWVDEQGTELNGFDFVLDFDHIPSFIAPEDSRILFEVGRSLRLLREHHPDHPLARPDVIATTSPPHLEWSFSWKEILQTEAKALQYERDLLATIQVYPDSTNKSADVRLPNTPVETTCHFSFFGKAAADMEANLLASITALDDPVIQRTPADTLSTKLNLYLLATEDSIQEANPKMSFATPVSLVPALSFNPIMSSQARVVNGTCMRMFFKHHNLREHLDLQHSFHLLGNGVFSSRLSHALFDPELETAERQRGVARSGGAMGLRLGGRDNWPPASSELRLALMGLLTESYTSHSTQQNSGNTSFPSHKSLPGDLSFAVRDMSQAEIERCMDPNSVEALDFLRLSYKPPQPLDTILTPMVLYKYDQIFKLLLRIIRMLYVVSSLFQDLSNRKLEQREDGVVAQHFRIEAQHFVSSICGYFFDTGIRATWRIFQRKLDQIEQRINADMSNVILGQDEGIDKLKDYHEKVVDRIMFVLLLRKRQQPVLKLLEEVFTLILQFSDLSRQLDIGVEPSSDFYEKTRETYVRFRKKVGVFIVVCRSLSEKAGYGEKTQMKSTAESGLFDSDDLAEENTVSQLLSRLEMSSYYNNVVAV